MTDIRAYVKTLMDRNLAPSTINGYLRSIKTCLNYFLNEGIIEENPAKRVPMTKVPKKTIKTFEVDQLHALFQA